ncbi:DUF1223 domain-containing protein [Terricaulis sp.]|uniref:DUF1223 domain-containing protein n=1 Tax=Terricaulis sp. TaxID=2768686 RepID=UPI003783ECA2
MIARLFALVLLALAATATAAEAQEETHRPQVVVELYTSQGCTQCPRANRLLGRFSHEDGVLALTFAVGIWDYLGWSDTFAQPAFGDRQRAYSRALRVRGRFTPQLVMNGARQVSASDWDDARAALEESRAAPRHENAPDITISRLRNNRVRVTVGSGRPTHADIWLVAFDPGPLTVVVAGGVNVNRTVAHYNVVRTIERIDTWNGTATWFERPRCTPECAVIVQEPDGGRILSAAYTYRAGRY